MNPLRRLAGETALYGASSVIGRFLNYLLFPLHTLVFPTGDYGIITELYVYAGFLNVIYLYGLETAYFRFSANKEGDDRIVFSTGTTLVLITSLVFTALLVSLATPLTAWMGYEGQEHFVYLFAAILALDAFFALPFARLRRLGRARTFASAKLFGIFLNIFINLFFLGFCFQVAAGNFMPGASDWVNGIYDPSLNLEYVFTANLAGSAGVVLFLFPQLARIRIRMDKQMARNMLRYGYPLLFSGLAIMTNEMLSRAALKYWLPDNFYPGFSNQQILGIFGGVFKLAILMNLGIQAFRYAAEPFFFNQSREANSPQLFSKLMTLFTLFGCVLWIGVSLNLDLLQYLLRNPDYRFALDVVPWLMLASLFMGINYNMSAWYKLSDYTQAGTWITLAGATVTIVGNYFLIPVFGYFGSAYAAIGAYATMCMISYTWSKRKNPIPWEITKLLGYILLTGIIIYSVHLLGLQQGWISSLMKNGIILVFIAVIYMMEKKLLRT